VLELDELGTHVGQRRRKVWRWLALCQRTRQGVAYVLGCRGRRTAQRLWRRIPTHYRTGRWYTDLWEADRGVVPAPKHLACELRGPTNRLERFNAPLRARLGRLVRESLSFSRCPRMLDHCIRLFLQDYNASRYPH
jgi:insertion element IS1 protein InsB